MLTSVTDINPDSLRADISFPAVLTLLSSEPEKKRYEANRQH